MLQNLEISAINAMNNENVVLDSSLNQNAESLIKKY